MQCQADSVASSSTWVHGTNRPLSYPMFGTRPGTRGAPLIHSCGWPLVVGLHEIGDTGAALDISINIIGLVRAFGLKEEATTSSETPIAPLSAFLFGWH